MIKAIYRISSTAARNQMAGPQLELQWHEINDLRVHMMINCKNTVIAAIHTCVHMVRLNSSGQ